MNCSWFYSGGYCPKCGNGYFADRQSDSSDDPSYVTLTLNLTDDDIWAKTKKNLWLAMHKKSVNKGGCLKYVETLKALDHDDYYVRFCEVVCSGDDHAICAFLNKSSVEDMEMYADSVLDYMCGHMTERLYYAVHGYMTRSGIDASEYGAIENYAPKFPQGNGRTHCIRF